MAAGRARRTEATQGRQTGLAGADGRETLRRHDDRRAWDAVAGGPRGPRALAATP